MEKYKVFYAEDGNIPDEGYVPVGSMKDDLKKHDYTASSVYKWIKGGLIRGYKLSISKKGKMSEIYVHIADLLEYLETHPKGGKIDKSNTSGNISEDIAELKQMMGAIIKEFGIEYDTGQG